MARTTQYSDPIEAKLERLGMDVQYEPTAAQFDAAEGLYWFCNDNYAGQGDPLYSILSRLRYDPGPRSRGVESEAALLVYEALQDGALDPEELLAWIEGRRSNPCHGRARRNPVTKSRLVGKRLQAGNASIMVTENSDGSCDVVTVFDDGRAERDGPYTRAKALQVATLTYETMKHQGRTNPGRSREAMERDLLAEIDGVEDGYEPVGMKALMKDAELVYSQGEWHGFFGYTEPGDAAFLLRKQVRNANDAQVKKYHAALKKALGRGLRTNPRRRR